MIRAERSQLPEEQPVEPVKPIVYYIDPYQRNLESTSNKVSKNGKTFWNGRFPKCYYRQSPPTKEEDPDFSPEDARYQWFDM
jgi:hypothetical protein